METATRVLITGGAAFIAYGFLLGLPLSMVRMRSPHASRHLVIAHLAAIIQGAVLLGLSRAVELSDLSPDLETTAAFLLIGGMTLFDLGATANWLQKVGDHFAERSLGWKLLSASGPLNLSGAAIVLIGVARGL